MIENTVYHETKEMLRRTSLRWLITGAAGFIGSNLVEHLLLLDQAVWGMDNFSLGKKENLALVKASVSTDQWERFRFVEGDSRDLTLCRKLSDGMDFVLFQSLRMPSVFPYLPMGLH